MNRFALGLIRRKISVRASILSFIWYRFARACEGIWIDRNARIIGANGISVGTRTTVHAGAILAATSLNVSDNFHTRAEGSIRIGEDCAIYPGAILAAYGGSIELGNHVSVNPNC